MTVRYSGGVRTVLALLLVGSCTRVPVAGPQRGAQPGGQAQNTSSSASEPITPENFRTHPALAGIDSLVEEVAELAKSGKLELAERIGDERCENYEGDMLRSISRDAEGRARKLSIAAGSEDSTVAVDAYYDQETKLRFVFVTASAANDTAYEYRIYFGHDGEKLWEHRTLVRGPGYTFPTPWPQKFTPRDPEARFTSSTECD